MRNKSITTSDLFLSMLAILLVSVSFYQTWLGLEQMFGPASMIIALVLSLLLLFLCWMIRNAKIESRSTGSLVWIYIFVASFCFIANFNALYTRFMRTDIYTTELRDINEKYNNLQTDVESKLNFEVTDAKTRQAIRSDLNLLKLQITDPKNQGKGIEADQILERIEKLLGKKTTPLTPLNNTTSGYEDLANRYEEQIVEMVYNLSPEEKALMTDINNAVLKWNKKIQNLLLLSKKDKDDVSQGLIDESLTEYNKLGNRAVTILGPSKIKFEPALSKTQEVGKIGFAFDHAIKNFGIYQFVVLMGCILLDFIIVIIILLVTNSSSNSSNNRSVFNSKRGGKTLIPNN
jgi:hypothetical protein